ncbi:MAG: CYTH domain-containing protein [Minisyncoccia bacterium]
MKTEFEARFINIDAGELREKLKSLGATLVYPERLQRRLNMDYPDQRLARTEHGWIRLRDEGVGKVTLTYKRRVSNSVEAAEETMVTVGSFEDAKAFLLAIGIDIKSEQESRRESWELNGVQIDIDTWPWLPVNVEVEGKDAQSVEETAKALGFDMKSALFGPINNYYQVVYDIPESETISHTKLSFDAPCPWQKR